MDEGAVPPPAASAETSGGDRLESWKEIAAYLKREVRTVQRWEKIAGLPVHRLRIDKLGSVYAYKFELDAWREQRHLGLEPEEEEKEQGKQPELEEQLPDEPLEQADASLAPPRPRQLLPTVLLVAVIAVGTAYFVRQRFWPPTNPSPAKTKLVVLPFQNLSGDPNQDYFSDGLTEEMITQLGRLQPARLGVIARTSAMIYKGSQKGTEDVCAELDVNYVLEGSVRRAGDRIRIAAQLIQCGDQTHVWADTYDRDLRDVLALQSDVAQAIARQIELTLTPEEKVRLASNRPVKPEAYEAYLQGRFYWNQRDLQKSISYYNRAVAEDPKYALAYAGLASSYVLLGSSPNDVMPPRQARPQAKNAASKALQLDPELNEAHLSLANTYFTYDWDWEAAEHEFKRALELNPSNATAHEWYGQYLIVRGRPEDGLVEAQHARELDPLAEIVNSAYAEAYYYSRQYDKAIEQCDRALKLYPNSLYVLFWLGSAYREKKMYPEALAAFARAKSISGNNPAMVMALGHSYAVSGNREQAMRALEELKRLSRTRYVPALYFAGIYTGLNDKDEAFQWLDKAYNERTDFLIYLNADPIADPLRPDPRFRALLRRIGLLQPATTARPL